MTEADLKPEDPGVPCTFDLTYKELVAILHQAQDQVRTLTEQLKRKEEG